METRGAVEHFILYTVGQVPTIKNYPAINSAEIILLKTQS